MRKEVLFRKREAVSWLERGFITSPLKKETEKSSWGLASNLLLKSALLLVGFLVCSTQLALSQTTAPTISTHPQNTSVQNGGTATFTVNISSRGSLSILTSSDNVTYEWQVDPDGEGPNPFQNLTATLNTIELSNTLSFSATTADNGKKYRVLVTGNFGTTPVAIATSNEATLAVNSACATPTVFNVTGTASYCSGGSGVPVGLSNSELGVTYQLNNGISFVGSPVSGTGTAISFDKQTVGKYTVLATRTIGECSSIMEGSANVTSIDIPKVVAMIGNNSCVGSSTPIGVSMQSGYFQLYRGTTFVEEKYNTGTQTLDFTPQTLAGVYTVKSTGYESIESSTNVCQVDMAGSVTIFALPVIEEQPTSQAACTGGEASFDIVAAGDVFYAWQKFDAVLDKFESTGSTLSRLSLSDLTVANSGAIYKCVVTENICSVSSNEVTLKVVSPVTPTFDAIDPICKSATAPSLKDISTNDITGTWNPETISNTVSGTYVFSPNLGQCATSTSLSVTVNQPVTPTVSISHDDVSNKFCDGRDVTFTAAPTEGGETPAYQWYVNSNLQEGATTSTFTTSGLTHNDVVAVSMTSNLVGCIAEASNSITLLDETTPVARAKTDYVIEIGSKGSLLDAAALDNGSTDNANCDLTYSVSPSKFSCRDLGTQTVTFTVTDAAGNTASTMVDITVEDNIAPTVTTKNITVSLNTQGLATVTLGDLVEEAYDNCSIDMEATNISRSEFTCADKGKTTQVYVAVFDVSGNVTIRSANVTVVDDLKPVIVTKPYTAYLNTSGSVAIVLNDVLVSASDNCSILGQANYSPKSFNCTKVGPQSVRVTAFDGSGNLGEAFTTVTVVDTIVPIVRVKPDFTINLSTTGTANITLDQVDNGSTDNCTIATRTLSKTTFTCADKGANTVTLTVTDVNGNVAKKTMIVTVVDNIPPVAIAKNITINLNAAGSATISAADINNASSDVCGIANVTASKTDFTCANVGPNTVTLTVTDNAGNTATATATVTVVDAIKPIVATQNITVNLSAAGTVSITPAQINNESSDACGIANLTLSKTSFDCSNVGDNTVTLTVTDVNNNSETKTAIVKVIDNTAPIAIAQNRTVYLDASGTAKITSDQINNGSSDACGIASLTLNKIAFDCSNIGPNTVTLTAIDVNGNQSTATSTVTIMDTVKPIVGVNNINTYLDASGNATITVEQINNGSSDACGIATTALSKTSFTCANVGANTVTLTVTDKNGNFQTKSAIVTVVDAIKPIVATQNITVNLSAAGTVSITPDQINNGSTDNCGIANLTLSKTSFDCSNVGDNTVTLTVTDVNNNSATKTAIVKVVDNTRPIVITKNITVYLNPSGTKSITASQIDNGSNDACGTITLKASKTSFNCANVGPNTVTLTATDVNGNTATATAIVTIVDNAKPMVVVRNINADLNASGTVTITASQIDNGSTDACGIATTVLSKTSFNCSDRGVNTVTLTVTDVNGNVQTANATVTVRDLISPVARANNLNINLDANGVASITTAQLNNGSFDNCGIVNMTASKTTFGCSDVGGSPVSVVLTVTDAAGNVGTATAMVTVNDLVKPNAIAKNTTVYLGTNGTASITTDQINNGSTDNCGIQTISLSKTNFDCSNLGANTVSLIVTDKQGNTKSATSIVTVLDTITPKVETKNAIVYLDANGTAVIAANDVDNGSSDNCAIVSRFVNQTEFDCSNLGVNNVTLAVLDASGNIKSKSATVTVLDTIKPVIATKPFTLLVGAGTSTLQASDVLMSATDNCSEGLTTTLSKTEFNCTNAGTNTVLISVADASGNTATQSVVVTVSVSDLSDDRTGDTTVTTASTARFYVSAVGNKLTYRWQASYNNGANYIPLTDGTFGNLNFTGSATYAVSISNVDPTVNNALFRCVVTGDECSYTTTPAKLTLAPLPTTKLEAVNCDANLPSMATKINAIGVNGATKYRFKISNDETSFETTPSNVRYFYMGVVPNLKYETTYNVTVQYQLNNQWSEYGETCAVTTPASPISPKLEAGFCDKTLATMGTKINAVGITAATNYRFKITLGETSFETTPSTSRSFYMNAVPNVKYETTYEVSVQYQYEGEWVAYGETCNITTPAKPIATLEAASCDVTLPTLATKINATGITSATNYRFKVTLGETTFETPATTSRFFYLTAVPNVKYATTYSVQTEYKYDGQWSTYGPACNITTPARPASTQLEAASCDVILPTLATKVNAIGITAATKYRFKITLGETSFETAPSNLRYFYMSAVPNVQEGTTYSVQAQYQYEGIWSEYATACSVTTPGKQRRMISSTDNKEAQAQSITSSLTAYPNPTTASFKLKADFDSDELVAISVYDVTGRLIETITVKPYEVETLEFGADYIIGMYQVVITQGENSHVIKVVKD